MELRIIAVIEEQVAVGFTGKINVLARFNRQYLGHILFKNGEIIQTYFQGVQGLKAFYKLAVEEFSLNAFDYVVEPEVVDEKDRHIHYPYGILKNKMEEVLNLYQSSLKLRPPQGVKILIQSEIIKDQTPVTPEEFEVMSTLSDWNTSDDVYQHCSLLDHEITLALVSLRKKGALKILALKNSTPVEKELK